MPASSRPWSRAAATGRRRWPGAVLARVVVVLAAVGTGLTGCDGSTSSPTMPNAVDRGTPPSPSPSPAPTVSPSPAPAAPSSPAPSPTPSVDPGPALESATWGTREGGRSLAVVPAPWVRTSEDPTAIDRLWAELVEAEPEADAPGMFDQLLCHALGAADKDSWNLEPWRPDVGLIAVMSAHCNPT